MYFFAYGTLAKSLRGYATGVVVGHGTVRGFLLNLGRFPGIVLSNTDDAPVVHGTLWRLTKRSDEDIFTDLDHYEGAYGERPLYFRKQTTVILDDGGVVEDVWIYEFNHEQYDFDDKYAPIPSGDWFNKEAV